MAPFFIWVKWGYRKADWKLSHKSLFAIWCLRQKRAIFCQFFSFLKAHSSATQLKKGEKMAKKSRFLAKQPNRKQALSRIAAFPTSVGIK
jgi:hypothetical protein